MSIHIKEEELSLLITDYLNGKLSEEDSFALLSRVSSNQEYQKLFRSLACIWAVSHTEPFADKEDINLGWLHTRINSRVNAPRHRKAFLRLAFAATFALLLAVGSCAFWIRKSHRIENLYTQVSAPYKIAVPEGSRSSIVLPDGSSVILNAGSELVYSHDFGIFNREVSLTGEGYFKVTKDKQKPFSVVSGDMKVEVTGTTFNVSAYVDEDYVIVSLIEGKVHLRGQGDTYLELLPNEQARFNKHSGSMVKHTANVKASTDWLDGGMSFDNVPFTSIAHRLEHKFNIKILINSTKLRNEYYTGSFSVDQSVYDILREIDVENRYVWKTSGSTITISDRK